MPASFRACMRRMTAERVLENESRQIEPIANLSPEI